MLRQKRGSPIEGLPGQNRREILEPQVGIEPTTARLPDTSASRLSPPNRNQKRPFSASTTPEALLYSIAEYRNRNRNAISRFGAFFGEYSLKFSAGRRLAQWWRLRRAAKIARSIPTRRLTDHELVAIALLMRVEGVR